MYSKDVIPDILSAILIGIDRIERRFGYIASPDDFVLTDEGVDRLDSIAMMLIAIGEQVKRLDAITDGELIVRFPEIDWRGIKGIRDVLRHHYFNIDAEIIYDVCATKIAPLKQAIIALINEFTS